MSSPVIHYGRRGPESVSDQGRAQIENTNLPVVWTWHGIG